MRIGKSLALLLGLILVVGLAVPIAGVDPFDETPDVDECLGPEDPFCEDGEEGGGGGSLCWKCKLVFDANTGKVKSASCENGTGKKQCDIEADSDSISCTTTGDAC